jgi:hypothetical protein
MSVSKETENILDAYDEFQLRRLPAEELFSRRQVTAGRELIDSFKIGITSWIILLAQMQSGKTETYLLVCCELIRDMLVSGVVIFSGNRETDLKKQLKEQLDRGSTFFEKYDNYLEYVVGMKKHERTAFLKSLKDKIQVVWGTDLTKYPGPTENLLLLWEEAHYAQSVSQCPDKFLKMVGISADGNEAALNEKGNFVLTVSATPFSELSDLYHLGQTKRTVYMEPGDGYTSVKLLRNNGKIKPFTDFRRGLTGALNAPRETPKYAIVRVSNKNVEEVKVIAQEHGWDTVEYDSLAENPDKRKGEDVWNGMDKAPAKNTLILIRGKCRMGKNLEKKHILFVMETSKNSNTDTVLQSLLGRVCGYSEGSDNIDVYLHQKIVQSGEIDRYISMIEDFQANVEMTTMPSKAKNVTHHRISEFEPIIPIQITRSDQSNDTRAVINDAFNALTTGQRIQNKNTEEQFNEVVEKFMVAYRTNKKLLMVSRCEEKKKPSTRDLKKARDIEQAFTEGTARHFGVGSGINSEGTQLKIWITKKNTLGQDTSKIYITAHTRITERVEQIPRTTLKEVFAHTLEDSTEVFANGGYVIHLTPETSNNEAKMSTELFELIDISLRFANTPRKVTPLTDMASRESNGIYVTPAVQKSLEKGGKIFKDVKEKYGFTLAIEKTRGPVPKKLKDLGLNKLVSISW